MNILELIRDIFSRLFAAKRTPEPPRTPATITMSREGQKVLRYFEGLRLTAYKDLVGVWTIAYGETGPHVREGLTWTIEQAEEALQRRLANEFAPGVLAVITRSMKQHELDAMIDLAYNVGVSAFQNSTLVKKFNAGDTAGAADEFLRWDKAGQPPVSVRGLRRRRVADRALFLGLSAEEAIELGRQAK